MNFKISLSILHHYFRYEYIIETLSHFSAPDYHAIIKYKLILMEVLVKLKYKGWLLGGM